MKLISVLAVIIGMFLVPAALHGTYAELGTALPSAAAAPHPHR